MLWLSKSLTIASTSSRLDPIHPGEVLLEEFIKGFGITQHRLALAIGVPPRRINEIVLGKRSITADTALRLSRYFGTSAEFWCNLQDQYNLDIARDHIEIELGAIQPVQAEVEQTR